MNYLTATVSSLFATLRQAAQAPTTVQYPAVVRPRAERIRASFALLRGEDGDELCIGCKKCEKVCPCDAIVVTAGKRPSPVTGKNRGYATDFVLNLQGCSICELCVQVCPEDALVMTRRQEPPSLWRAGLTLDMARLYRNGENKERLSWSTASVLADHQKPETKAAVVPPKAPPPQPEAAPAPVGAA